MTYFVSNDPVWWPLLSYAHVSSYFVVASFVVVVYDWALTFAQEVELIWRQRWSFMSVLYFSVRYIGILYTFNLMMSLLPVPVTDLGCNIVYFIVTCGPIVVNAMLGVIMMTRVHAMYGQSNKMLIFLAVLFVVSTIATGVVVVIGNLGSSGGEAVLSGYHICVRHLDIEAVDMNDDMIIPTAIWEILAFFLAVWIVIKHLRELQQSQRSTIGDCFTVLMRSHALYFIAFAVVACFTLGNLSQNISESFSLGVVVYDGIFFISREIQMCVLGPRLILSVREYNAKLVARSDEGTHMTSIAFQAGGDASTSGDV